MKIKERMNELGISLPPTPAKGGVYASVKSIGEKRYYVSGCGSFIEGKGPVGKVGAELTLEEGKEAAKRAMLNFLSVVEANLGELDKIKQFTKVLVFVASSPDFYHQPEVADGATELLVEVFGEEVGAPSRSAVGVTVLPGNIPAEVEGVVEIE